MDDNQNMSTYNTKTAGSVFNVSNAGIKPQALKIEGSDGFKVETILAINQTMKITVGETPFDITLDSQPYESDIDAAP